MDADDPDWVFCYPSPHEPCVGVWEAFFIATSALIYAAALLAYWLGFTAVITLLASQTIGLIFRLVGAVGVATGALMIYRAREEAIACKFGSLQKQQTFRRKLNDIFANKDPSG